MTTPPLTRPTKPRPNPDSLWVVALLKAAKAQPGAAMAALAEMTF